MLRWYVPGMRLTDSENESPVVSKDGMLTLNVSVTGSKPSISYSTSTDSIVLIPMFLTWKAISLFPAPDIEGISMLDKLASRFS